MDKEIIVAKETIKAITSEDKGTLTDIKAIDPKATSKGMLPPPETLQTLVSNAAKWDTLPEIAQKLSKQPIQLYCQFN